MKFYLYHIIVDGVVRYVGKGSGYRAQQHLTIARRLMRTRADGGKAKASYFHNKLAKAMKSGSLIQHQIVADQLSEDDAYGREMEAIASAPVGQLWNQKSGGSDGVVYGPEVRRKLSVAATRRYQDPNQREQAKRIAKEIASSEEVKAKRSAAARRRVDAFGMGNLMQAHTPDVYRKRGETLKQTLASRPELRNKVAVWRSEDKLEHAEALKAAHARPEVKAKRRAYYDSPEGRAKLKAASHARWAKVGAA